MGKTISLKRKRLFSHGARLRNLYEKIEKAELHKKTDSETTEIYAEFQGELFNILRARQGLSVETLSKALGILPEGIHEIEKGVMSTDPDTTSEYIYALDGAGEFWKFLSKIEDSMHPKIKKAKCDAAKELIARKIETPLFNPKDYLPKPKCKVLKFKRDSNTI